MICDRESDAALLERFARRRDEAAFETLVERHGPMVRRACRRVLRSEQDVEDVFQATFLVLAHKAGAVCWEPSIGGWLHSAARRLALHARTRAGTRRLRERPLAAILHGPRHPSFDPGPEIERRDLRGALDVALDELPEKYRAPVVLCYFEGKTNEEAARELGWPTGSMSRRLERARCLLRHRLAGSVLLGALVVAAAAMLLARPSRVDQAAAHGSLLVRPGIAGEAATIEAPEQLAEFARKSERVARALGEQDPGGTRLAWLLETSRMRLAATDLALAVGREDRGAMLSAARRLDATCVRCHEVFRP